MDNARFTSKDIERVAREAAEQGARAALAKLGPTETLGESEKVGLAETLPKKVGPAEAPSPELPAWLSVAEYARHIGKASKTVREYARRAPLELVRKYGRDWRLAGPAFDAWVRAGGPFRVY